MVKLKGGPLGAVPMCLTVIFSLLAGLVSAGPLQRPDESAVTTLTNVALTFGHPVTPLPHGHFTLNDRPAHTAPTNIADLGTTVALDPVKRDIEVCHDFGLVCGNRVLTGLCQGHEYGYSCDSAGRVTYREKRDPSCEKVCQCINTCPGPGLTKTIPCYASTLPYVQQNCFVKADSVYDHTTGAILGKTSEAVFNPDGTLEYTPASVAVDKRSPNLVKRHDWTVVCGDRATTLMCTGDPYRYTCDATGKLILGKNRRIQACTGGCTCLNNSPVPCIKARLLFVTTCLVVGDTVFDLDGTVVGRMTDATVLSNGTLDFNPSTSVEKRSADLEKRQHNFAPNCNDDRELTANCRGNPWGYSCDERGKVIYTGTRNTYCEKVCDCVDMNPKPLCVLSPFIIAACAIVDDTLFDANGTALAKVSDAIAHSNGIYDLTPATIEKRSTDINLVKRLHAWAIDCEDRETTMACSRSPHSYSCNSKGRVTCVGDESALCEATCGCVNTSPLSCLIAVNILSHCGLVDNMIVDENGTTLARLDDSIIHPNGTYDLIATISRKRDTDLVKRHDWTINCNDDRENTKACSGPPHKYSCDKRGKVTCDGDRFDICDALCKCTDMSPKPCILAVNFAINCKLVDDTLVDDNGKALAKVSDVITHPNGTYDLISAIEKRNTDLVKRHNYAPSCANDRAVTARCIGSPWKYNCDSRGKLTREAGPKNAICEQLCTCVDMNPKPCILTPFIITGSCFLLDDTVVHENGTFIANLSDATVHPNGTLDLTAVIQKRDIHTALVKRNKWALNCNDDRDYTTVCQSDPIKYNCDSKGKLTKKGTVVNDLCDVICKCINMAPLPCILKPNVISGSCFLVDDAVVDENGTAIAPFSDAVVLSNGTLDLTAAIEKRNTLDLTTAIEKRNSLDKRPAHEWAPNCDNDKETTKFCLSPTHGYNCDSKGKVTHTGKYGNPLCDSTCKCVDMNPKPCILTPYIITGSCFLVDDTVVDENGTAIAKLSDAVVLTNGTLDLTAALGKRNADVKTSPLPAIPTAVVTVVPLPSPTVLERVTIQDIAFGCETDQGFKKPKVSYDDTLTKLCKELGYYCYQADASSPAWTLNRPGILDPLCDANCYCAGQSHPKMAARDAIVVAEAMKTKVSVTTKVTAVATTTPTNTLDFSTPTLVPALDMNLRSVNLDGQLLCFTKGKQDDALTTYCSENGYACLNLAAGSFLDTMYHDGKSVESCDKNCQCPQPFRPRDIDQIHPVMSAKPSPPASSSHPHPHHNATHPTVSRSSILGDEARD